MLDCVNTLDGLIKGTVLNETSAITVLHESKDACLRDVPDDDHLELVAIRFEDLFKVDALRLGAD